MTNVTLKLRKLHDTVLMYYDMIVTRKMLLSETVDTFQVSWSLQYIPATALSRLVSKAATNAITAEEIRADLISEIDFKCSILTEEGKRQAKSVFDDGVSTLPNELVSAMADLETYNNWDEDCRSFLDRYDEWWAAL